jgi:glycosyltransferase involved in cell wall biosynthesis
MSLDDIGVVVIGRNEGARLIACLASIKSEASSIVYVDSGSTDGSTAAAEGRGAFVVNLDLRRPFTAARARNEGFLALKTRKPNIRFVQFIDGDCTLVDDWLDAAAAFLNEHEKVAVVFGQLRERNPAASVYNQLCDLEWHIPVGEALTCGGNVLVRVEAFEAAGGFRPELIGGEEPELCVRLRERGWKVWRVGAEMGLHDAAMMRFSQWWLRSVRWGYALAEISRLHWASPVGIWRREFISTLFWGIFLPLTICFATLIYPLAIGSVMVYPLKLCWMALGWGPTSSESWMRATFTTLAKFPACQGILKFYRYHFRHKTAKAIEYK